MQRLFFITDWPFFNQEYLGEKTGNYILFLVIVLGTLLLKRPVAAMLTRVSSAVTAKYSYVEHRGVVREILLKPMDRLVQVVLYYIAVNQLDGFLNHFTFHHSLSETGKMNYTLSDVIDHIFLLIFIVILARTVSRIIDYIYMVRIETAQKEKNQARIQLLPLVKEMSKMVLWIIGGFWILGSVFHVNIPALITGLGIGGVAIALAAKETVENFFASFTILSDKPFQTGDLIKLGDVEAVVERIGFRSTRLRNMDGSAYIIPNQKLVNQNLINLSARERRGVTLPVHIKYGITFKTLEEIMEEVRTTLTGISIVREPVILSVEGFDKETFQLVISYDLPHPLPANVQLADVKKEVNLKVFEIISGKAVLGTAPGTS